MNYVDPELIESMSEAGVSPEVQLIKVASLGLLATVKIGIQKSDFYGEWI